MSPSVFFTGGGTAGHVTPNLALIKQFQEEGWQVEYVGSKSGIEKEIISALGIPFHSVQSGKLRRYFSLQNLWDPFKILLGIVQSFFLFYKKKPDVVFSKGGFVAFPVVFGAWLNRIPVIAHESDISPGLANKLSFPFVRTICLTFDAGLKYFKNKDKLVVTGTPIRKELFNGHPEKALELCGFTEDKPCILVIGGSLGAGSINSCIRSALDILCRDFQVIHICGKGKSDKSLNQYPGYFQLEYAQDELADLYAVSSLVISRAGANSLYEILALGKPNILIPLSAQSSRGDQIQNARYFKNIGVSALIEDEELNPEQLVQVIHQVLENKENIIHKISELHIESATHKIVAIIKEQADVRCPKTV